MLWLRERLLATFPALQPDDIRVTPSGTPGPDLQLSPAAQRVFPFAVESKNHEALNIWAALKQAESHSLMESCGAAFVNATSHDPPYKSVARPALVVFTRNRSKIYVALEAETFLALLKEGTG